MTNREAINLLEEIKVNKAYTEALEMALKALEAEEAWYDSHEYPHKEQWIPVAKRLPKPNDVRRFYLVQNEYGDMMVASFNKSSASECTWWEQIYQYGEELPDIVAWMPLPMPWEGSDNED